MVQHEGIASIKPLSANGPDRADTRSAGLRKWPFVRCSKADWRPRPGPREPEGKTAESRLYERDLPDILV